MSFIRDSLLSLDTNEDGVLDEQELEALFTKEVNTYIIFSINLVKEESFAVRIVKK